MSIYSINSGIITIPISDEAETPEPELFLNHLPFESPRFIDVAHLRDRKIALGNEILRQTTQLEQMELPRKLKLIGLWTGIILIVLAVSAVFIGAAIMAGPFLAGLSIGLQIMAGIAFAGVTLAVSIKIAFLLQKLSIKCYQAIQKPKEDLSTALTLNINEWEENRNAPYLKPTLNHIREMLPYLQRLKDPLLCNLLERDHAEDEVSQRFNFRYKKFLNKEIDASTFLSAIQEPDWRSKNQFYLQRMNENFFDHLPANILRYDQLKSRGAAVRAALEPRDGAFEGILKIAEGYMGLVGSRPESAPLPDPS